ncbi:LysR family transcriptional regulator [Aeromonas veronii]|uniref:LysR family transcriptional regulator n=1 Tax=Aeromonas veronii TaxID=654 RepID=UPI00406BD09F
MTPLELDLNDLYLFTHVVQRQGFTAAARALGVPKSRISRRIRLLEERLDTRLLQRTSRQLSLTDAGEVLYRHCQAMLAEAQAGEAAVRQRQQEPSGLVRISVPITIADALLARLLPAFMVQYPKVRLAVQASNRQVDLLEEGLDVVIRGVAFEQPPSSLVQVPLCTVQWGVLATPACSPATMRWRTLASWRERMPCFSARWSVRPICCGCGTIAGRVWRWRSMCCCAATMCKPSNRRRWRG